MRGLRSFLALLVILIGLGGYLYFVESERTPDAADDRDLAFELEAEQIDALRIRSSSGEQTALERTGDAWQVVEPLSAPADPSEVSSLTSSLATLRVQRALDDIADFAEFGLAEPRIVVQFNAGGQERRLALGLKTPPGSDIYARVDEEPRVILVPVYLESTFDRGTFDLRDKSIVRSPREAVNAIGITSRGRTTELVRADGEWRITQPVSAAADYGEVNGLVSRLMSAQMRAIEEAPREPGAYGLDRPAASVRTGSADAPVVLHLGRGAGDDAVYGMVEGRPEIFTVDATLLEALQRDPGEYRQKDLFDARAFNAARLEITRDGATRAFEKRAVKGDDGKEEQRWRQVEPADADVDGGLVDSVIFSATGTRAESFVAGADAKPPATPDLLIVIRFDEGRREDRVSFWRRGDDAFASRADAPGAARISTAALDDILRAIGELP
jgi:muconolactone delta-isomerase